MAIQESDLACQVVNAYKGKKGEYIFYAECRPRELKETDPALNYGKTSIVSFHIFDSTVKKSAVAYTDPGSPAYLYAKVNACMAVDSKSYPEYATRVLKTAPYTGLTAAEAVYNVAQGDDKEKKLAIRQFALSGTGDDERCMKDAIKAHCNNALVGAPVKILDEVKTPDVKKIDENGNTDVRTLKIFYHPVRREYKVEISNFKAPPVKNALVGAIFKYKTNEFTRTMKFSEGEFFTIVDEIYHAKEMYAKATEGSRIRYAESKAWRPNN